MQLVQSQLFKTIIQNQHNVVNPRPAGGGAQRAPCGFSQIAPEVLEISL